MLDALRASTGHFVGVTVLWKQVIRCTSALQFSCFRGGIFLVEPSRQWGLPSHRDLMEKTALRSQRLGLLKSVVQRERKSLISAAGFKFWRDQFASIAYATAVSDRNLG